MSASAAGGGRSGKTLGGVARQTFTPNVNARRNKKQTAEDPLSRLLHADALPELPLAQPPAAPPPKPAVPKRQSPRLSPRQSPASAAKRASGAGASAGGGISSSGLGSSSLRPAPPGVIQPPSSLAELKREADAAPPDADDDGIDGMDLEGPPLLPPQATAADETAWLLEVDAPVTLPMKKPAGGAGGSRGASRPGSAFAIGSLGASRVASRPASRASGTSLLDAMSEGERSEGARGAPRFKPGTAAAALLEPPRGHPEDEPSLLFFQMPMHLPVAGGGPEDKASAARPSVASPTPVRATDYLAALAGTGAYAESGENDAVGAGGGCACGTASSPLSGGGGSGSGGGGGGALGTFRQMPAGPLGELVVYKSGKVMLSVGGMLLDVHPGAATSFDQEVVALDETEAATAGATAPLCRLGKLQRRMVVTPNLDDLLARCAREEAEEPKHATLPAPSSSARKRFTRAA